MRLQQETTEIGVNGEKFLQSLRCSMFLTE